MPSESHSKTRRKPAKAPQQYTLAKVRPSRLHVVEKTDSPVDVEQVLKDRSLRIAFQPVCDLKTREVIGYEALARFPDWAVTTPRPWFEQALELGLQQPLELLAATMALEQLARLEKNAFLSVNLAPATAASKEFDELCGTVPADRLVLEITENATVDNYRRFTGAIDHLRSLGVRIALDDAGAADIGMQHLLELRPDIVKIDTAIIHGIADDELLQAVAYGYASLARRAGAISLAEGIETEAELAMLSSLEVETGQGYLLGRPMFLPD